MIEALAAFVSAMWGIYALAALLAVVILVLIILLLKFISKFKGGCICL